MSESDCPDWYFDRGRSAHWYFHKPSNAYYLYTEIIEPEPNSPERGELLLPNSDVQTGYPLWYYDQGRSMYWYYCEEVHAYCMYQESAAHPHQAIPSEASTSSVDKDLCQECEPKDEVIYYGSRNIYDGKQELDDWRPVPEGDGYLPPYQASAGDASIMYTCHMDDSSAPNAWCEGDIVSTTCPDNHMDFGNGDIWEGDEGLIDAWQAQYGQVARTDNEAQHACRPLSLWNWRTKRKRGENGSLCLVGQLASTSSKLHPSLQINNGFIKTSRVYEVDLDLVKVLTGEIFRLRQPSSRYLASIAVYDAANPTKDWDFPRICFTAHATDFEGSSTDIQIPPSVSTNMRALTQTEIKSLNERRQKYKDRAKSRRELYGGYGDDFGRNLDDDKEACSSSLRDVGRQLVNAPIANCLAKRMLEKMGWHEGEGLGRRRDGIVEPLQGAGNNSRVGLGWTSSSTHRFFK